MSRRPARIGLAFALTLAVPAALTATWAWLELGGAIATARQQEDRAATQCLTAAGELLDRGLQQGVAHLPFLLELDEAGRIVGPFAAELPDPDTAPAIGIAEQTAGARLAARDVTSAIAFFEAARERGELSAMGWIALAREVGASEPQRASDLLQAARKQWRNTPPDPVPFAVLAALTEAQWANEPAARERLVREVIATLPTALPAAVDRTVARTRAAMPEFATDERLTAIAAAARVVLELAGRSAPTAIATDATGDVQLPQPEQRLAVLPNAVVARALDATATSATTGNPTFVVTMPALDRSTWTATPATTPTSALLTWTARGCLGLGIAILVLGNLVVWRLTRRELALVRMRRDFVDVVSHELRTPLTALSLKTEMLQRGDVPAHRQKHYLDTLYGDVQRLTDQVDRILAFGRLEKGAALQRETVPARAVLARGLRAGRPALRLVDQQLEVEAPRALPALDADVEVLTRALRNLLENAAKYAPAGSTVAVRAFVDGGDLVVEVGDHGPGIPATDRRMIFEPFVRRREAQGVQGSGLGLALVAAAAKAHGGRAEVRDRAGGGAVFTLRLPTSSTVSTDRPRADEAAS
ncbi:MAG: HAMP domain-containing histidine kinase [bacterium]|nr:HAMP domain-containing histidine kinase [bacterium]